MKIQVNLKIDKSTKTQAQKKAKDIGISLSSVVNATLKQFARTGEFYVSSNPSPTPYLEEIVLEARKDYREGHTSGPFDNANDLIKYLGI